ncbi:hypothetical protein [Photobacterium leiognathi]|uniref:hypothetical protein n=1 Tax=Photobacterium leiognathi TaxID=553611 RepID=UPI002981CB1A|nr:hypothetical protein [Photobacterium leiognathi]
MYIPSKFLSNLIISEQVGVFCESNSQGEHAIIAKLSSSTIKSISLGAKVEFFVYFSQNAPHYIGLVLKIYDNQESPMHAILAQRWESNANQLNSRFFNKPITLVLFDETDAPVMFCSLKIKINFRNKRILHLLDNSKFRSCNNYSETNNFMDDICIHLQLIPSVSKHNKLIQFKFNTDIEGIHSMLTVHVNEQTAINYDISHEIDGSRQEKQIAQALSLLKNSSTYLSPVVNIGKKERELTDILTIIDENSFIAVESKCLQINLEPVDKSYDRLSANIIKHTKKAINQLEGVYKALSRGEKLYTSKGVIIDYATEIPFYGIILIDEFRYSDDWSELIHSIKALNTNYGIIVNIISVSELIYSIKVCHSNPYSLIQTLDERYKLSTSVNSPNVKVIDSSLPVM